MKNWLQNKVVLVTGASSGIGKEISKLLIKKYNCKVLGVGRTQTKLEKVKSEFGDSSSSFEYLSADVSKKEDWQNIFDFAKCNNCDVVVNNAGTMPRFLSADRISEEEIQRVLNTNFYSCVYSYQLFCDYLKSKKDGAIINIASSSAVCSIPGQSIYSASKSALVSFSKIVSAENSKKIFIGTYLPGFTKTDLFVNTDNPSPIFDEKSQKVVSGLAMSADKMAGKIVRAMSKKKPYRLFGKDAKLLKLLNSLMPVKSSKIYLKVFKKSNFECFKDVF